MIFAPSWRRVGMGGYWIGGHVTLSLKEKISNKSVMRWCNTRAKIQGNARLE
jgi:hypothetical protein